MIHAKRCVCFGRLLDFAHALILTQYGMDGVIIFRYTTFVTDTTRRDEPQA